MQKLTEQTVNENYKKKFFEKSIFDPKNLIWLEILRFTIIIPAFLAFLLGFILTVDTLLGGGRPYYAPVLLLLASILYYIVGMVSLNLFYNVQQIRVNTSKNN
jgi:uncharacterized membrane protein